MRNEAKIAIGRVLDSYLFYYLQIFGPDPKKLGKAINRNLNSLILIKACANGCFFI
jgi:hypothetical protein